MRKILLMICLTTALMLPLTLNAQTPIALNLHGGYSWLNGVVGGEIQFGRLGISGGWMPTRMPLSGDPISSIGIGGTLYSSRAGELGYSGYVSMGVTSQGYQYEDSWGGEATEPVTIIMTGLKYDSGGFYMKGGVGYGWCDYAESWTGEILIGFTLFSNQIK